jgi:hypothetical protein
MVVLALPLTLFMYVVELEFSESRLCAPPRIPNRGDATPSCRGAMLGTKRTPHQGSEIKAGRSASYER